ncbi:MAG: hypothetical protein M1820_004908 [Bogoriella megaspora]|nr:MAG: hypothetical protein M1820_004908 [Bogoriella megaspora]
MASDSQRELVIRSVSSGDFSQSGTIDWVGFLKATAEASISILTRLSGSGVEPLTVLVAEKLCSQLQLSSDGQKNILEGLSSLRAFGSFGDVLWFGFGVRHVTRTLAQTREGLGCVAICAALAETHSSEVSALVLSAMADLSDVPRQASPSISQWKKLVEACSGCLAKSAFPQLVGHFTGLCRSVGHFTVVEACEPRDLAQALGALARISDGHLDSITIKGGPDCGWLGAVAQWLLGLSVSFQNDDDETTVHRGCYIKPYERAQVNIIYDRQSAASTTASIIVRKAYKISGISSMVREQIRPGAASLCIRTPWDQALRMTFGEVAFRLLTSDLRPAMCAALRSAAILFERVSRAGHDVRPEHLHILRKNVHYLEGSYGRGFLQSAIKCFPELPSDLVTMTSEFLGENFNQASMAYENALANISASCPCERHGYLGKSWSSSVVKQVPLRVCIVTLMELIIYVARASAGILAEGNLLPAQNGFDSIYRMLYDRLSNSDPVTRLMEGCGDSVFSITVAIYSGAHRDTVVKGRKECISATASQGLCFFLDSLCDMVDSPESLSRVHVVPGCIELDQRKFMEVRDSGFEGPRYKADNACVASTLPAERPPQFTDVKVEAIATEAENFVTFSYKITSKKGTTFIPAAALATAASRAQGCVPCDAAKCPKISRYPLLHVVDGEGTVGLAQPASCTVRFVPAPGPRWCIALMTAMLGTNHMGSASSTGYDVLYEEDKSGVILRTRESLVCCIKASLKHERSEIISIA